MSRYDRFAERYASRDVPWDRAEPPPEVLATAPALPVGRALDLGCGFGRAALFLARLGWHVDAVDFVPAAIEEARARARAAGLADRIVFHVGDIADMAFLDGPYDLAIDVGTLHSLEEAELRGVAAGLARLLRPGAQFLLFAHLDMQGVPTGGDDPRRWLDEAVLHAVFGADFQLERSERGTTQVGDNPPWPSAWFWFRRAGEGG
ncbi:class I SAM-dependent methyltransferase [bacterium]|nr:MAG: class I SAM-dependent methyltransferase [bacterium]